MLFRSIICNAEVKVGDGIGAYLSLRDRVRDNTGATKQSLITELIKHKMDETMSLEKYNFKFIYLKTTLTQMGFTDDEDFYTAAYLEGLSNKYNPIKEMIDMKDEQWTLKQTRDAATKFNRMNRREIESDDEMGMQTKYKKYKNKGSNPGQKIGRAHV